VRRQAKSVSICLFLSCSLALYSIFIVLLDYLLLLSTPLTE
jgi:hypothetical protein